MSYRARFSEAAWVVIGQIGVMGGLILQVYWFSKILGPNGYGELVLALTAPLITGQIIYGPLANAVARLHPEAVRSNEVSYFYGGMIHALGKGIIIHAFLSVIAVVVFCGFLKTSFTLFFLTTLYSFFNGVFVVVMAVINSKRDRGQYALRQIFDSWARVGISIFLMKNIGASSENAISGYVLASALGLTFLYRKKHLYSKDFLINKKDWCKKIFNFAKPFSIHGPFTWLQLSSDKWALQYFGGLSDVGIFALIYQLFYFPFTVICAISMQIVSPIIYGCGIKEAEIKIKKYALYFLIFALISTAIVFFGMGELYQFLPEKYKTPSLGMAWIVCLGGGIFSTAQLMSLIYSVHYKLENLTKIKIFISIFGCCLNIVAAKYSSLDGIFVATLIISIAYLTSIFVEKNLLKNNHV